MQLREVKYLLLHFAVDKNKEEMQILGENVLYTILVVKHPKHIVNKTQHIPRYKGMCRTSYKNSSLKGKLVVLLTGNT